MTSIADYISSHDRLHSTQYDAIVAGSGYGGGVAARALARMGLKVAVLEAGRHWQPGDFGSSPYSILANMRIEGQYVALGKANSLFQLHSGPQMHVLTGCGLGGGSLVNAGLAFRPDAWVMKQHAWPEEIGADEDGLLEKGYEEAGRVLGPVQCPGGENILRFLSLQRLAREIQEELGEEARAELAPSTINFDPNASSREQRLKNHACTLCGDCWMGCNAGAKKTIASTYLAEAASLGAEIFTSTRVDHLQRAGKKWRLACSLINAKSGKPASSIEIETGLVVLAAGVFGSTSILMRSRDRGLAISKRLGHSFSANGDDLFIAHNMPQKVNGIAVGEPPRGEAGEPVGPNCIGMMTIGGGDEPRNEIKVQAGILMPIMAALSPLKHLISGRFMRAWKILRDGNFKGVVTYSQCFYVVGHDDGGGRLEMKNGRLLVQWPGVEKQPVFSRSKKILAPLLEKIGARYVQNPLRDSLLGGRLTSVHPLGGCSMGRNVSQGVTDHRGRVFNPDGDDGKAVHEGLMVLDGSIIPTSLGANPLLTITALAERAMAILAAEKEHQEPAGHDETKTEQDPALHNG